MRDREEFFESCDVIGSRSHYDFALMDRTEVHAEVFNSFRLKILPLNEDTCTGLKVLQFFRKACPYDSNRPNLFFPLRGVA